MSAAHPSSSAGSPGPRQQELDYVSRSRTMASRRREKPQLSCNFCRRRKQRCDRQQPCSTCSSRGLACIYADDPLGVMPPKVPGPNMPSMHDRIVQLELLVMSFMPDSSPKPNLAANPGPSPGHELIAATILTEASHPDTPMDGRSECGSMRISASELSYVGGDHWAAILDGIADLKAHFDQEEQSRLAEDFDRMQNEPGYDNGVNSGAVTKSPHALLLYGCQKPVSRAEILAGLPPKDAVDRYISRYFNRLDLISCAIHGPTFLREYDEFWANPSSMPIMWIGLLFSMICLAELASDLSDTASGSHPEQQSLQIEAYREKTAQCLVIGEYTKSGPYALETMSHYVYMEFLVHADAARDVWFLNGLVIYQAMRMGYHRDPSHFPGISPLQGEMRRRIWFTILQGEVLISGQMGMPRMISDWQCDTAEPRNLNDTDLDDETVELPPSRPETEHTTTLGLIARRRMLVAIGQVSDQTASVKPCSYAEVMRVDGVLQDAAENLPPPLKMKSMAASLMDTPQVIMIRLFIRHMFYKGQVMLHRRFLYLESTSQTEDSFAYSRKACLDASLGTLQIQHILDEETRPGGQLHMLRWRKTSIMNHQFLIATMVLCSLLHRGQTLERAEEITAALRRARTIWLQSSSNSREARKAAETVSIVLARAGRAEGAGPGGCLTGGVSKLQGGTTDIGYTASGDGVEESIDQQMLRDPARFYEPDQFVMPAFLGTGPPSDIQEREFSLGLESMGKGWHWMSGYP